MNDPFSRRDYLAFDETNGDELRERFIALRSSVPVIVGMIRRGLGAKGEPFEEEFFVHYAAPPINQGDGGDGKTSLMQQLQSSCATALPWIGLRVEECISVGFYTEEEDRDLKERQRWIDASYGQHWQDAPVSKGHSIGDTVKLHWKDGLIVPDALSMPSYFRRAANDVFLALLDEHCAANRHPLSESRNATNFAPKVFAGAAANARDGYALGDFKAAMESLFKSRKIKSVNYGRSGDERRKIVRCDSEE